MDSNKPWEPDRSQIGNRWTDMFNQAEPHSGEAGQKATAPQASTRHESMAEAALDTTVYRPWLVQRGQPRPAVMLGLRRYEARSRLWEGWAMPYAGMYAVEHVGDRMVSLDFGGRQFVIEGHGLDELAQRIQQGEVMTVQEYAAPIWPVLPSGPLVSCIRRVIAQEAVMR